MLIMVKTLRSMVIVCLVFSVYFTFLYIDSYLNLFRKDLVPIKNVMSCHYVNNNNVLLELGAGYKPQHHSIFFHETSCGGNLTSRQACAVESAARAHPDWDIHLLFSSPLSDRALEREILKELYSIKNVKIKRVNIKNYAIGTPLEKFILEGDLNKSKWIVEHTSDVLRYLTLYKWGGVYMDLDVVVVKSLGSLARNWAARESDVWIGSAILAFSRDAVGRFIAEMAVRDISANFNGDIWTNNGPGVITRVLKSICSTKDPTEMSSAACNGFEVYEPQIFYPVHYERSKEYYFMPGNHHVPNVYVHHLWNFITKNYKVHKDSPYAKLAKKYCPTIFKLYGDDFGK